MGKNISSMIRVLKVDTIIIIFDNDKHNKSCFIFIPFKQNIDKLLKCSENIILISQNKNLEDEIVLASDINDILKFHDVQSLDKHKNNLIKDKNLLNFLDKHNFKIDKFWCS